MPNVRPSIEEWSLLLQVGVDAASIMQSDAQERKDAESRLPVMAVYRGLDTIVM